MISFRDYLTEPPKILCGIRIEKAKKLAIVEELHVEPYVFIIPKDKETEYSGEIQYPGVVKVHRFGKGERYYAHREPGKDPIEFANPHAAEKFIQPRMKKHDKDLEDIHQKLSAHYYRAHNQYGVELSTYGRGSSSLNYHLMTMKPDQVAPMQALKLDHALNHTHTPDDMIVYSGISGEHESKIRTNDVVHHPAFLSTSLRLSVACGFSSGSACASILKIHVPANHPGAYIGDLSGSHRTEREFLLPRGLKLRVHHDKEMIAKTGSGVDFRIHHCTIEP